MSSDSKKYFETFFGEKLKFLTDAHRRISEAQSRLAAIEREKLTAAEAGDVNRLVQLRVETDKYLGLLAHARTLPQEGECRHCGEKFELHEYTELVISAIVRHRPAPQEDNASEGATTMIFPRGEELHMVYCPYCAIESRLMDYLTAR